ncbi:MAG: hypothetical protein ACH34U_05455, partial [Cyanobium sp.]
MTATLSNRHPSPEAFPMPDRSEQGQSEPIQSEPIQSVHRPAPMFELIPYEKFRDTPSVRFFDI